MAAASGAVDAGGVGGSERGERGASKSESESSSANTSNGLVEVSVGGTARGAGAAGGAGAAMGAGGARKTGWIGLMLVGGAVGRLTSRLPLGHGPGPCQNSRQRGHGVLCENLHCGPRSQIPCWNCRQMARGFTGRELSISTLRVGSGDGGIEKDDAAGDSLETDVVGVGADWIAGEAGGGVAGVVGAAGVATATVWLAGCVVKPSALASEIASWRRMSSAVTERSPRVSVRRAI